MPTTAVVSRSLDIRLPCAGNYCLRMVAMAIGALQGDAVFRQPLAMAFQALAKIGYEQIGTGGGLLHRVTRQTGAITAFVILKRMSAVTEMNVGEIVPRQAHRRDQEAIEHLVAVRVGHVVTARAALGLELVVDL